MAGSPRRRAFIDIMLSWGGEEWLLPKIEAGESVASCAQEVLEAYEAKTGDTLVNPTSAISYWAGRDPDRKARYREARRIGAAAQVEGVTDHLTGALARFRNPSRENPSPSREEVSLIKELANHERWKASRADPEMWGERKEAVNVNLNLGGLHLEALKAVGYVPSNPDLKQIEGDQEIPEAEYDLESE